VGRVHSNAAPWHTLTFYNRFDFKIATE